MSEQVHIRVGEGRRETWKQHAKEDYGDKYGSVAGLIRSAVETQMALDNGDLSANGDSGPTQSQANGRLDDVFAGVQDNGQDLGEIKEQLAEIRDLAASTGAVSDAMISDVYGALPVLQLDTPSSLMNKGVTPSEIAEEVDISEDDAARALGELNRSYDDMVQMIRTADMDEPRYGRTE